jgi:rhodanese-related sulfurtransferase
MKWKQFFTPVKSIGSHEAKDLLQQNQDVQIIDVRQPGEYQKAHIAGSKLIPLATLGDSLDQLDKEKPILVY